jgi:hypothetical protein
MSKRNIARHCFVVDASIAHAAGGFESRHPTGIHCRDFLIAVRGICHSIAWNESIKLEWEEHSSLFTQQWLVSMMNLRKSMPIGTSSVISEKVHEHCKDTDVLAIVLKDCHLFDAALATDSRIASLDEQARYHWAGLAGDIDEIKAIVWVNPGVAKEGAIVWLKKGAPAEKRRQLGNY